MPDNNELKGVWAVLREIKTELAHLDDKWETHIKDRSADSTRLSHLCVQVDNIERLLTRGNGQKSVLVQLEHLGTEMSSMKEKHKSLAEENAKVFSELKTAVKSTDKILLTEEEIKKQRWMTLAKVAGVVSLAAPGILALFGIGG